MKHIITSVTPGSITHELGLSPGDVLLAVNGQCPHDVFDYRFLLQNEKLLLEIQKSDGELWELDIEKDDYEDLGLSFRNSLMSRPKTCRNRCVFCFIDQMPPNMRHTLYVKDDDPRLSFLSGNYITLTNLPLWEVRRIARYHLSPLHISVHTIDPALRSKMMGNAKAGRLLKALRIFKAAGIAMHFQVVLCKGLNDGAELDRTIGTLLDYRLSEGSLAIVPAGLTKYREGLYPLTPFTQAEATGIVMRVEQWQRLCRKRYGTAFVFCADEFYLKAGMDIPPYKRYEGFPQLENGVGMLALFEREFIRALKKDEAQIGYTPSSSAKNTAHTAPPTAYGEMLRIGLVTGRSAGHFMNKLSALFCERHPQTDISVYEIENKRFGPEITVSGLLTGRDVISQLQGIIKDERLTVLFLPRNMFRAGKAVTLDGLTPGDISIALGIPVRLGGVRGGAFYKRLKKVLMDDVE
jgi:putative radical SAM enzyme (TIGR03279 family)